MRIGVFSDDLAGAAVALLAAQGLMALGEPVRVLEGLPDGLDRAPCADDCRPGFAPVTEDALAGMLGAFDDMGANLVVVLPLGSLADVRLRGALDVVLTAGRDHPASARALRAARYAVGSGAAGPDADCLTPAWFVPCSHQADLSTRANLSSTGAVPLPFAARAIPFMVPRSQVTDLARPGSDDLPVPVLQTAVLLASLVVAVASDPRAPRIGAGTVAALMETRVTDRDRRASDRLIGLAAEFARLDAPAGPGGPRRSEHGPARRPVRASSSMARAPRRRMGSAVGRVRFVAR